MKRHEDYQYIENDIIQYLTCAELCCEVSKERLDELESELRAALDRCVDIRDYKKEL